MKADPEISVVVTAHREGRLAHRTLASIRAAVQVVGGEVEVIAVLDRADDATRGYFRDHQRSVRLVETDFGDTGPARNAGVNAARGHFVAFLDGDDLMGRHWLRLALAAGRRGGPALHTTASTIVFGPDHWIVHHLASDDPRFFPADQIVTNHWNPLFFAPRDLVRRHPFGSCPRGSGFGFEDWHWCCELVAAGVPIRTVEQGCYFYRQRRGGRQAEHVAADLVIRPSRLFDPDVLRRWPEYAAPTPTEPITTLPPPQPAMRWSLARSLVPWRLRAALRLLLASTPRPSPPPAPPPDLPPVVPNWLLREWRDISAIEPGLEPEPAILANLHIRENGDHSGYPPARVYAEICRASPPGASNIILAPGFESGATLDCLNEIRERYEDDLLVVMTEPSSRLESGLSFVDFGQLAAHLTADEHRLVLTRFLLQQRPRTIHNLNAAIGLECFARHGAALASLASLHAYLDDAANLGLAGRHLAECFDHLTAVTCARRADADALVRLYALDPGRMIVRDRARAA